MACRTPAMAEALRKVRVGQRRTVRHCAHLRWRSPVTYQRVSSVCCRMTRANRTRSQPGDDVSAKGLAICTGPVGLTALVVQASRTHPLPIGQIFFASLEPTRAWD